MEGAREGFIIESYSAEGGHSAHRVCTDHNREGVREEGSEEGWEGRRKRERKLGRERAREDGREGGS